MEPLSKKDIILKKAAGLFHKKGYSATTMRELAQVVGIEASSLYSHINSKEELLIHLCFTNAKKFSDGMTDAENMDSSFCEKIEFLLNQQIRIALEEGTSVTVFDDEWKHLSEPHLGSFLQVRKDYQKRFIDLLCAGMEKGEFKTMDPMIMMNTLISSIRWVHLIPEVIQKKGLQDLYSNIGQIILTGIKK